jgi:hypothetical protein
MSGLDPAPTYTLEEVFGSLGYPAMTDHDYFVAAPPAALTLDPSTLSALEVRAPFFVDHGWSFGPDANIVPFVWDNRAGGQPRFSEGEALTDYDSGLVGLAAVSGDDATAQAQLYRVLSQAIVEVHRADRELLAEWLDAQGPSSHDAFMYFDRERLVAEEKLLAADGSIDDGLWDARLDELATCLTENTIRKHHLRWIEFLAHAVNVPQLIKLAQGA